MGQDKQRSPENTVEPVFEAHRSLRWNLHHKLKSGNYEYGGISRRARDFNDEEERGAMFNLFLKCTTDDAILDFCSEFGPPVASSRMQISPQEIRNAANSIYRLEALRDCIVKTPGLLGQHIDIKRRRASTTIVMKPPILFDFKGSVKASTSVKVKIELLDQAAASILISTMVSELSSRAGLNLYVEPYYEKDRLKFRPAVRLESPWAAIIYELLCRITGMKELGKCPICGVLFPIRRGAPSTCGDGRCRKQEYRKRKKGGA